MKQILALFAIFLASSLTAQTIQKGVVKEYNEKAQKTPLTGVELNVRAANSTVSDKAGNFSLQFLSLKPGERVNVRRIEKLGYEIFNKEAIEQWNLNPNEPFVIVMCRSDRFKKIRDNYEKVSSESYARQLKKEELALAKLKEQGKLQEAAYQRQLVELRENYERQIDNLDSYIDRFSRIDLSELSDAEQKIIDMLSSGDIEGAIAEYDRIDFIGKYIAERNLLDEVSTAKNSLEEIARQKETTALALKQSVGRQIDALRLAGGKSNFQRIGSLLRQLADADTTDAAASIEFASFAFNQNETDVALPYMRRAYRHGSDAQKLLAKFYLEAVGMLVHNDTIHNGQAIRDALESHFCKENPILRQAFISMLVMGDLNSKGPESNEVNGYIQEMRNFQPTGELEWSTKINGAYILLLYNKSKGNYADSQEYMADLKQIMEYCTDFERNFGFNEFVFSTALSVSEVYLSVLLSNREIEEFDSMMDGLFQNALRMFRNNPVPNLGAYRKIWMLRLTRELIMADDARFSSLYSDYLKSILKSDMVDDELILELLSECFGYVNGKIQNGLGDPTVPADVFYSVFPPSQFNLPQHQELVAALELLLILNDDRRSERIESLMDGYLKSTSSLKMPRILKGEFRLKAKDEVGARKQVEILKSQFPEDDFSQLNLFLRLNNKGE